MFKLFSFSRSNNENQCYLRSLFKNIWKNLKINIQSFSREAFWIESFKEIALIHIICIHEHKIYSSRSRCIFQLDRINWSWIISFWIFDKTIKKTYRIPIVLAETATPFQRKKLHFSLPKFVKNNSPKLFALHNIEYFTHLHSLLFPFLSQLCFLRFLRSFLFLLKERKVFELKK